MKQPYIPLGCDQQGRRPDRAEPNVGADPIADLQELESESQRFFEGLLVAVAFVAVLAIFAMIGLIYWK